VNSAIALAPILAAFQVVSANSAPLPPAPAANPVAAVSQNVFLQVPFDVVKSSQDQAWVYLPVGQETVGVALGFDSKGSPWVKLKQRQVVAAAPLPRPGAAFEKALPAGNYRVSLRADDTVNIAAASDSGDQGASVSYSALFSKLYSTSYRVELPEVTYGILYEDGTDGIPPALDLLREDGQANRYSVSSHTLSELRKMQYLIEVTFYDSDIYYDIEYFLKISGSSVVFYAQTISPQASSLE